MKKKYSEVKKYILSNKLERIYNKIQDLHSWKRSIDIEIKRLEDESNEILQEILTLK